MLVSNAWWTLYHVFITGFFDMINKNKGKPTQFYSVNIIKLFFLIFYCLILR